MCSQKLMSMLRYYTIPPISVLNPMAIIGAKSHMVIIGEPTISCLEIVIMICDWPCEKGVMQFFVAKKLYWNQDVACNCF